MPAKSFIAALYLVIAAMLLQLIAPMPAHAVNWNSDPVAPITTTDAATADFWQACSTNAAPDTTEYDGYVSWFAWTQWNTDANAPMPDSGMYCVTTHYADDETTITSLAITFYRGTALDVDWLFTQIHAEQ